ncbi:tellurite resistance/C4-dicarboxylate transporter family protein [Mycobacterium celatum]|uniref:C4-dicarboxylate ABC transporter n=1 Tax=Mycobacterium celatum TaxID=28045 RepID=A0A1X1RQ77_MYCCE|nr:tellurite resistance/C4-dicarboxylate transporter family protein [Mycobacterium celatum]ORV11231.1 C4-dicarboxylate ABC transporter [Mycobacterium celatum]PIB79165.1 C4-dicarboxylate ABC transporter [Mycobacterium celatum]
MTIRLSALTLTPDVFSAVMATGILSIAARNHHYGRISGTLGILASVSLLVLVALVVFSVAAKRRLVTWDLSDPDVTLRLFTFVAACAVLDSRLASDPLVAWVLGLTALSAWLVLMALTARNMSTRQWTALRDQAHGAWELASVGTSGLAIVSSQDARYTGHHWWLGVAVPIWIVAIVLYGLMTWLILWRAVAERQDRDGFEPDTWILMGALAIATLAGDDVHQLAPGWLAATVRTVTIVTWAAATLWIPPLIYVGLHRITRRPDVLQLTGAWWTLVFPLGMYSVATHAMAFELGVRSMRTISLVFFWNALVAWVIVAVGGLLRFRRDSLR